MSTPEVSFRVPAVTAEGYMPKAQETSSVERSGSLKGHKFTEKSDAGEVLAGILVTFFILGAIGCIAAGAATQRYYLLAPGVPVVVVGGFGGILLLSAADPYYPAYPAVYPAYPAYRPRVGVYV